MAVEASEKSVLVVEVVDRLCLLEVEVAGLHVMEVAGRAGLLAVTGLGQEAGGQNDHHVEVEVLEQSDWGLVREGEALVCQVEGVEVQTLLCSLPF